MIKLSVEEKMTFVHSYIENEIDLALLNENASDQFEASILKEFEDLLELSQIENVINWHKSLSLPKVKVEDLLERVIETPSGKILMGIRFLGMDINNPFVSIWANFNIKNELENIISLAKEPFKIFQPKHIRFWVKPNSQLSIKYNQFKEQSFYVNKTATICLLEYPLNYNNITLEPINDLAFYDWYKNMYDEFHLENKELKYLVTPNDKEDFEPSIKIGLVFHIVYQNQQIGIISAEEQDFLGEKSLYITEIVIDKEFKGKKLATAVQRKFIEWSKNKYKYVWGMISSKNIPSSKNALRVGRIIIRSEILLPI